MKYNNLTKMRGFTAIEYVAIVAAIAIATIAVVSASSGFFSSSKKNTAILEVSKVVNAAKLYRIANNDYNGITIQAMVNSGYDIEPFTDGVGENAYGANVAIVSAASDQDATLTYATDSASACASLDSRFGDAADGISASACDANFLLTLTVD